MGSDIETRQKTSGEVVVPPTHSHVLQNAAGVFSQEKATCIPMKITPRLVWPLCLHY